MHILVGLLAAIGVIGTILWRFHMASQAAKGLAETSDDVRAYFRKRKWQKKYTDDVLTTVDDARVAVTVMLVALAQSDGLLTSGEQSAIKRQLLIVFNARHPQNEELFAHARWLLKDNPETDNVMRRMFKIVQTKCDAAEIDDVFQMLESVAGADGKIGDSERRSIAVLKDMARR